MPTPNEIMVEHAARVAAEHVINETFMRLGINTLDPIEVQKDMAALRELRVLLAQTEFKKDLFWIRRTRTTLDTTRFRIMAGFFGIAVTTCAGVVSVGLKELLTNLGVQ